MVTWLRARADTRPSRCRTHQHQTLANGDNHYYSFLPFANANAMTVFGIRLLSGWTVSSQLIKLGPREPRAKTPNKGQPHTSLGRTPR